MCSFVEMIVQNKLKKQLRVCRQSLFTLFIDSREILKTLNGLLPQIDSIALLTDEM